MADAHTIADDVISGLLAMRDAIGAPKESRDNIARWWELGGYASIIERAVDEIQRHAKRTRSAREECTARTVRAPERSSAMPSARDPRKDPRPGDVLIPKTGYQAPTLVVLVINTTGWHEVKEVQPFGQERGIEFHEWLNWMKDAEVIYAAD